MDAFCSRCARLSVVRNGTSTRRAYQGVRRFSAVQSYASDGVDKGAESPKVGRSLSEALTGDNPTRTPRRPIVRKYPNASTTQGASENAEKNANASASTRTAPAPRLGQILRRTPSSSGPILRRTQSNRPEPDQAGDSQTGEQGLRITRFFAEDTGNSATGRGQRPSNTGFRGRGGSGPSNTSFRGRGGPGNKRPGDKRPDRRRRLAPKQDEDAEELEGIEEIVSEQLAKNIDPPPNPTTFTAYDPSKLSLDQLRADWPNTPLSTTGMTESVIQKIEWLARRLPHGYQSPQQIAEHYLKGNLTRFESDEERETVLKLASELSAKTKSNANDGLLHKHETPRFQIVEDPAFTSLAAKSTEKNFLVDMGVKGEYENVKTQQNPLLQNIARTLHNNETYGPIQTQKFLNRIESLMPRARAPKEKAT